jgi:L-asparaginase II
VAIKVEDGSSRVLPAIVAALLAQLGALDEGTLAHFTELHSPLIRNDLGAVVGERRPVFALA